MSSYILARKPVEKLKLNTGVTNITTGAWVQISAATAKSCSFLDIYNPTTKILVLAIGSVGAEVELPFYIYPGVSSQLIPLDMAIPKGSRLSAKAVDADAVSGYLLLNLFV